jgi:hypothetical protein
MRHDARHSRAPPVDGTLGYLFMFAIVANRDRPADTKPDGENAILDKAGLSVDAFYPVILETAADALGPQMSAALGVDQLCIDARLALIAPH